MKTLNFNLLRYTLRVAILLLGFASLAYSAFAQSPGIEDARKQLGKTFREAMINKAVVCDFVDDEGRVTLQGVLLADRLSFALLEEQGFETLNRDRLNMHLYGPKLPKNESLEKAEINAAQTAGAEVIVTGKIQRDAMTVKINVVALSVSTGQQIGQGTFSIPRTQTLDDLAAQFARPNGAIYLAGQNGISMPACAYCPTPAYTDEARKNKLEGKVVVTAIIDRSGKAEKVMEVKGLGDGLTEQAIAVVRQWHFKPARDLHGHAVSVMVPVDVSFSLM
jgi:TonB family protein